MTLTPTTRASLLFRLRSPQDQEAWMEFVAIYEPVAYRLLRRHGLQDADAREVMQELFMAVSRSIERWDPAKDRGSFRGWLRRVTRNLVINWMKQRSRRVKATGGSDLQAMLEMFPAKTDVESVEFDLELRRAQFQRAADQVRSRRSAGNLGGFLGNCGGGNVDCRGGQKTGNECRGRSSRQMPGVGAIASGRRRNGEINMNDHYSAAILESALTGQLPQDEEQRLHQHLEQCPQCSEALEQMAGGPTWCREAAALLTEDALDADVPTHEHWSEIDFTVEHLEPADEPNVLGRLGGYDVLEVIGRGGMGVVLKALDRDLKRLVAIKVLAPHLAQSPLAKKRFAREAQAAAAVVHSNVLAIHQVQPLGRLPFLVMPLVAGESLAERLTAQGTLELKEILRISMQAAAGLAAAHEQGLVHRDVKPANILLEHGIERAVLTDFGLARAADDVTLTRWGIVAGTPQYMSPEQARGEPLDGRSRFVQPGMRALRNGHGHFAVSSRLDAGHHAPVG